MTEENKGDLKRQLNCGTFFTRKDCCRIFRGILSNSFEKKLAEIIWEKFKVNKFDISKVRKSNSWLGCILNGVMKRNAKQVFSIRV